MADQPESLQSKLLSLGAVSAASSNSPPNPRSEARAAGSMFYDGLVCPRCGGARRYVSNRRCVVCMSTRRKEWKMREGPSAPMLVALYDAAAGRLLPTLPDGRTQPASRLLTIYALQRRGWIDDDWRITRKGWEAINESKRR